MCTLTSIATIYLLFEKDGKYKLLNICLGNKKIYIHDVERVPDDLIGLESDIYEIGEYKVEATVRRRILSAADLEELEGFRILGGDIFYEGSP